MHDADSRNPPRGDKSEPADERRQTVKVTDRRLFDRNGNLRSEIEVEEPAAVSEPEPEDAPPKSPAVDAPPADEGEPDDDVPRDAAEADDASSPIDPTSRGTGVRDLPRDLSAFVQGQYIEAMLYLGAMPHPQSGEVHEDIDLAQYRIDVLTMLHEKTEGNRTLEEDQLLEEVLYQLRMLFLQKSNVPRI